LKTHPLHNPVWAIELCDFLQAHQINPALAEAHFRVLPEEIPESCRKKSRNIATTVRLIG